MIFKYVQYIYCELKCKSGWNNWNVDHYMLLTELIVLTLYILIYKKFKKIQVNFWVLVKLGDCNFKIYEQKLTLMSVFEALKK